MFTGIIEEVGKVVKIEQRGENRRITIEAASTPKELGTGHSIATTAPAGTKIVISCRIATSAGRWDKLTSPYRGLFVRARLVHSHRPARC